MTHYCRLAEATERDPERHGPDLTFRETRVPVDRIIPHLNDGRMDTFLDSFPSVRRRHVEIVAEVWEDLRREVSRDEARRQLRFQAAWALVSERASRLIEREEVALSEPPSQEELVGLTRQALANLGWSRPDSPSAAETDSLEVDRQTRALHCLADAASELRTAADNLRGYPVHAAYARDLASRIETLRGELGRLG